jgi:hypothetical protein
VARPLPPPLPPAERTVGQLLADAMRLYGQRFWRALPLGLPLAVLDQIVLGQSTEVRVIALAAGAPFLAAAYAGASALVARTELTARAAAVAIATGSLVLLPASLLIVWFALLAAAYLAFVGLVVPVAVIERRGPLAAFRRAGDLARADYVHAVGALAALAVVFFIARLGLVALLAAQAENTLRVAVLLADVALGPLLFLGAALLYFDQAARLSARRARGTMPPASRAPRRQRPVRSAKSQKG